MLCLPYVPCHACSMYLVMPVLCTLSYLPHSPLSHSVYKGYFSGTFLVFVYACNIHCLGLNRIDFFLEFAAMFTRVSTVQGLICAARNSTAIHTWTKHLLNQVFTFKSFRIAKFHCSLQCLMMLPILLCWFCISYLHVYVDVVPCSLLSSGKSKV